MVPTEMLFSRLADPSSGSIATQSGASGLRVSGNAASLGKNCRDRGIAQRAAHHFIGGDIDILLSIAIGVGASVLSGDAGQRSIRDQDGKIDRSGGDGLDHHSDRGAMRLLRSGSVEMRP